MHGMKKTSAAAAILALAAFLSLPAGGPAAASPADPGVPAGRAAPGVPGALPAPGGSEEPALSREETRVEAWWLVSVFRFDEAKKLLASLDEPDEEEIELALARVMPRKAEGGKR